MENTELTVRGMTCMGCVKTVKRVLETLPGVNKVDVALDSGKVAVEHDPAKAKTSQLEAAIEDAGFEVVHQ